MDGVFLRALVFDFVQMCILVVHSARGYDLIINSHQMVMDVVVAIETYQHGDPTLIVIAVFRALLAVLGSTHSGSTLARDQWRWWKARKPDDGGH